MKLAVQSEEIYTERYRKIKRNPQHTCLGVQCIPISIGRPGADDSNHVVLLHILQPHIPKIILKIYVLAIEARKTTKYPTA